MTMQTFNHFSNLSGMPDSYIDLSESALHLCLLDTPGLDMDYYLEQLDIYAATIEHALPVEHNQRQVIDAMNHYLFEELAFCGNLEDYENPENSCLATVIDTKKGIPITLSLLYMEVGRRLGLAIQGVSFPGHFLVKAQIDGQQIFLDPFVSGCTISHEELDARLLRHYGEDAPTVKKNPELLRTASRREILIRMLRNLKKAYMDLLNFEKALTFIELVLTLEPDSAYDIRDRGMIYQHIEYPGAALKDLERYLELEPDAPDRRAILSFIDSLSDITLPPLH